MHFWVKVVLVPVLSKYLRENSLYFALVLHGADENLSASSEDALCPVFRRRPDSMGPLMDTDGPSVTSKCRPEAELGDEEEGVLS